MTSPTVEIQIAADAALVASADVLAIVFATADGPAIYARGQDFDAVYPRITFGAPERVPRGRGCGVSADIILTVHCWAQGPDCTLKAGALADAVIKELVRPLPLNGWRVSSWEEVRSRPVGDPDPTVEHFVTEIRWTVHGAG
ncbi:hypothetical protein SGCZBJ_03835 [Caulobacter zeae]|uniref:DUF3168 domain-containing protein n=1 Tax=Caulobacter zeae TaxID=2055137 RepID=A0A2N5DQ10_9CAUL|nr:DUF3168 domain-containing protein [Caulobacter zeae]PLR28148.1 hypothetical protein SGCZBJ_03835 [Caulobacter zeae]